MALNVSAEPGANDSSRKASAKASPAVQSALLSAAKALDDGSPKDALESLRRVVLTEGDMAARLVALALWKRMVMISDGTEPLSCKDAETALSALNDLGAALLDEKSIWAAYRALPVIEKMISAADAAAAVAGLLWDRTLAAHQGFFAAVFELFFRGGDMARCREAWHQFLKHRKDHVPTYWHFLLYCKTLPAGARGDVASEMVRMLAATDRQDLRPLVDVYLMQMRQMDCRKICAAALELERSEHRIRVSEYMTGLGYMPEDLPVAVAAFRELAKGSEEVDAAMSFMAARLANAKRSWQEVLPFADTAAASAQFRYAARLLAANALGQLGQSAAAKTELDRVAGAPDAADYLRARAAFIHVTVELVAKGLPTPDVATIPDFKATPGRPLAQSLWVGRRLRWIEELAIKSYLDNGWRFQLYAYDAIENAPKGCEVLDANAILPRKDLFREGFGSGLHAGSLGAFSDLFRYRLLYERGGMWTDTDVVNLRRFDPDGARFISTEISDAGLVTLNGAIMAAPAGHAFMGRAYERACELLRADEVFFTRIGPYLLAELMVELGVDSMTLMPPNFLSAVFWMNTGDLLEPYESFMNRLKGRDVVNLHIYTEMWRMLGLGLDKPPARDTFLGRLYAERFADRPLGQAAP